MQFKSKNTFFGISLIELLVIIALIIIITLIYTPIISKSIKRPGADCNKVCNSMCTECDKCKGICNKCEDDYELINNECIKDNADETNANSRSKYYTTVTEEYIATSYPKYDTIVTEETTTYLRPERNTDYDYYNDNSKSNLNSSTNYNSVTNSDSCHYTCGVNCLRCDTCIGYCSKCDSDFSLVDGSCVCNKKCRDNETLNKQTCECVFSHSVCHYSCGNHCAKCDNCTGSCLKCLSGYELSSDGSCVIKKVETTSLTSSKECIKKCPKGYELNKNNCTCVPCAKQCSANCTLCDKCTAVCSQCKSGWELAKDGSCVVKKVENTNSISETRICNKTCDTNCISCDKCSGTCIQCKSGYKLVNTNVNMINGNTSIMQLNNLCVAESNNKTNNHQLVNNQKTICNKPCPSHCRKCDECTGICKECKLGFVLYKNSCVGSASCNKKCDINCSNCDSCSGKCSACKSGYELLGNFCVSKYSFEISAVCSKTCPAGSTLDKNLCICIQNNSKNCEICKLPEIKHPCSCDGGIWEKTGVEYNLTNYKMIEVKCTVTGQKCYRYACYNYVQ